MSKLNKHKGDVATMIIFIIGVIMAIASWPSIDKVVDRVIQESISAQNFIVVD